MTKTAGEKTEEDVGSGPNLGQYIPLDQPLIVKGTTTLQTLGDILAETKPKLFAIYFSMHNCPPCRDFTPLLASIYEEVNEDEKVLEVVFFSGDKTQEDFDKYYDEMPWLALPREKKDIMTANAKKFKI